MDGRGLWQPLQKRTLLCVAWRMLKLEGSGRGPDQDLGLGCFMRSDMLGDPWGDCRHL